MFVFTLVLFFAFIQAYIGKIGTYGKAAFTYGGIDLMVIQKTLLSLFFIIWLHRFENHKFKMLKLIAENSFGIYFTHGIVIWMLEIIYVRIPLPLNQFIIYFVYFSTVLILSLLITLGIKRIFPRHSRFIIGS